MQQDVLLNWQNVTTDTPWYASLVAKLSPMYTSQSPVSAVEYCGNNSSQSIFPSPWHDSIGVTLQTKILFYNVFVCKQLKGQQCHNTTPRADITAWFKTARPLWKKKSASKLELAGKSSSFGSSSLDLMPRLNCLSLDNLTAWQHQSFTISVAEWMILFLDRGLNCLWALLHLQYL